MRIDIKNVAIISFSIFICSCFHSPQNDYATIKKGDTNHLDIKVFDNDTKITILKRVKSDSINDGYYNVWEHGKLICSGQYMDGKKNGTWFFMNSNHDTTKIQNWFLGKRYGPQISYFDYSQHSQMIKNYVFWGLDSQLFEINFESTGNIENVKGFPLYCAFTSENISIRDTFDLIYSWGVPKGFKYAFSITETNLKDKRTSILKSENSDISDSKNIWRFTGSKGVIEKKYSSKGQYRWSVKLGIIDPGTKDILVNDSTEINLIVR